MAWRHGEEIQIDNRLMVEGAEAWERGLSRSRCPYEPGSYNQKTWLRGWAAAEQRFEDEWGDCRLDLLMRETVRAVGLT